MKKRLSDKSNIPTIIPPESLVELVRADDETPLWKDRIGKRYRIGYYSRQDGLDTIWLVDDDGNYCQTTDRNFLLKYYKMIRLSKIRDYFGVNRKPLGSKKEKASGQRNKQKERK